MDNKISSGDCEDYMDEQITKDHYESDLTELEDKNFLSKDEMILFNRLDKDDNVERAYNARYSYYYMKKKDFNREKWWLGWILEWGFKVKYSELNLYLFTNTKVWKNIF